MIHVLFILTKIREVKKINKIHYKLIKIETVLRFKEFFD